MKQLLKCLILLLVISILTHKVVAQNLISPESWNIGSGSVGVFEQNGGSTKNIREWGENPFGQRGILWKAVPDAGNGADGGWNTSEFNIDHTKMYRFSVWIKKTNSSYGTTYLGCNAYPSPVTSLSGNPNSNPYFWYGDLPELDRWYLIVGYVHGSGDTSTTNLGAIYDGETGTKVHSITDFKFPTTASTARHRSYLYYDTNTSDRQYFYAPRVDKMTGDEPSVEALLGLKHTDIITSSSKKTLNAGWYTIAKNNGTRASAKFSVRETKSGHHSAVHFYAQHHFGNDISNQIVVLTNAAYGSNGALRHIRIIDGSTYAGALVQVYIDQNSTSGCYTEITENIQETGWQLVDWEPATMTLPNGETGTATTEVDLDVNHGMIVSHDLWVGNTIEAQESIRTKEVKVEAAPWPDYVFEESHQLRPLEEVSDYINTNGHLPNIPTAKEVEENGIKLGEMNAKLLEKIEELTLYIIDLENRMKKLENEKP